MGVPSRAINVLMLHHCGSRVPERGRHLPRVTGTGEELEHRALWGHTVPYKCHVGTQVSLGEDSEASSGGRALGCHRLVMSAESGNQHLGVHGVVIPELYVSEFGRTQG